MNPEKIRQMIPLYIENELDPHDSQLVKECLEKDAGLKAYADELRKAWEMLDGIVTVKPSPAYISDFWTRLTDEKAVSARPGAAIRRYWQKWVPVLSAFCLVILVVAASHVYHSRTKALQSNEMAGFSADEIEFLENYELAENLDIIEDIDFLEDMEFLEQLEELEISYAA